MATLTRVTYTRSQLLHLSTCNAALAKRERKVRRVLWFLGILLPHGLKKSISGAFHPIPVRVTRRCHSPSIQRRSEVRERHLIRVPLSDGFRARRRIPSVLSNVCSLTNKVDECEMMLRNLSPDIVVLVEKWLDNLTPIRLLTFLVMLL